MLEDIIAIATAAAQAQDATQEVDTNHFRTLNELKNKLGKLIASHMDSFIHENVCKAIDTLSKAGNVKAIEWLISVQACAAVVAHAVIGNEDELLKCFTKKVSQDEMDQALQSAAVYNQTEALKILIKKGARVNSQNSHGDTALACAAFTGQTEAVSLLLANGADVNMVNSEDSTALLFAILEDKIVTAKTIIKTAADLDLEAVDFEDRTALMHAADKGLTDIVRLLVERGANLEAVDETGNTALLHAMYKEHQPTVECIVGCLMSLKDGQISLAATVRQLDILKTTSRKTPHYFFLFPLIHSLNLYKFVRSGNFKAACALASYEDELQVNMRLPEGGFLLHAIVQYAEDPIASKLCDLLITKFNANVYLPDAQGIYPFEIAYKLNRPYTRQLVSKESHLHLFQLLQQDVLNLIKEIATGRAALPDSLQVNPLLQDASGNRVTPTLTSTQLVELLGHEASLLTHSIQASEVPKGLVARLTRALDKPDLGVCSVTLLPRQLSDQEINNFQIFIVNLQQINRLLASEHIETQEAAIQASLVNNASITGASSTSEESSPEASTSSTSDARKRSSSKMSVDNQLDKRRRTGESHSFFEEQANEKLAGDFRKLRITTDTKKLG